MARFGLGGGSWIARGGVSVGPGGIGGGVGSGPFSVTGGARGSGGKSEGGNEGILIAVMVLLGIAVALGLLIAGALVAIGLLSTWLSLGALLLAKQCTSLDQWNKRRIWVGYLLGGSVLAVGVSFWSAIAFAQSSSECHKLEIKWRDDDYLQYIDEDGPDCVGDDLRAGLSMGFTIVNTIASAVVIPWAGLIAFQGERTRQATMVPPSELQSAQRKAEQSRLLEPDPAKRRQSP